MAAFEKRGGFSGYSAGCTFTDAFARQLRRVSGYPVKVVNWGYWQVGSGDRISGVMKKRLEESGIASLEAVEGMQALESLLVGGLDQLAVIRTAKPDILAVSTQEWLSVYPSCLGVMPVVPMALPLDPGHSVEVSAAAGADLNSMACRLLWLNLQVLGVFNDSRFSLPQLQSRKLCLAFYDRWLEASLPFLEDAGYLTREGDTYSVVHAHPVDAEHGWSEWIARKALWDQLQFALDGEPDPWFEFDKAEVDTRQFIPIQPVVTEGSAA